MKPQTADNMTSSEQEASKNSSAPETSGQQPAAETPQVPEAGTADTASTTPELGAQQADIDPVEQLRQRVEELEDKLLRGKAEFQNLQKRSAAERSDAIRFANADLMRAQLDVLDDFERSLEAAETASDVKSFAEGVKLIYDKFRKTLTDHRLEEIAAQGQAFDPSVHEALMQQATDDDPPGTVLEVVSRGYKLADRVIRPARVIVSKAQDD